MSEFTNGLNRAQEERLAILLEEMEEVAQMVGKIIRHGYKSTDPNNDQSPTNQEFLERELGDVQQAIFMLCKSKDIDEQRLVNNAMTRWKTVQKYLHHQPKELFD